jgi:uncharacterized damage-inducible protein DinB
MTVGIKDLFELLAKYNKITNQDMIKVLEGVGSIKLKEDLGSYYGSILGLLNHHLLADIGWIRALGTHIDSLNFVPPLLERFPTSRLPPKELVWTNLEEYKSVRGEIDDLLERVIKMLDASQYATILTIEGRRGKMEYITWRILLHLFNHQTHHRGGVSVLLDQLGVENDYSNLLWKV